MPEEQVIRIYIETPAGDRFQGMYSVTEKISQVAIDLWTQMEWPLEDRHGHPQRAVVELIDYSAQSARRLNADLSLGELVKDGDTLRVTPESRAGGPIEILAIAASIGTIAQVALMIADMWLRKEKKQISRNTNQNISKRNIGKDWDQIQAIYVEMTDGSRVSFDSWMGDPEKIKSFIQTFSSPSTFPQPLWVMFVLNGGTAIRVDVSDDAANKQQLEQLITYLNL